MTEVDVAELAFDGFVGQWTQGTTDVRRAPLLRRPSDVGLTYEDVTFPSMDGIALEGWFIPAGSDRLIIHNHFSPRVFGRCGGDQRLIPRCRRALAARGCRGEAAA